MEIPLLILAAVLVAVTTTLWRLAERRSSSLKDSNAELQKRNAKLKVEEASSQRIRDELSERIDVALKDQERLQAAKNQLEKRIADIEGERDRERAGRRSAEGMLSNLTDPPSTGEVSADAYARQLSESDFSHDGPVIEFHPVDIEGPGGEEVRSALLVRLPVVVGVSKDQLVHQTKLLIRRGADYSAPDEKSTGLRVVAEWSEVDNAVRVQNLNHIGPLIYAVPDLGPTLLLWTVDKLKRCNTACQGAKRFAGCVCNCGGIFHGRREETPWPGWTDAGYFRSYSNGQQQKAHVLEPDWWREDSE